MKNIISFFAIVSLVLTHSSLSWGQEAVVSSVLTEEALASLTADDGNLAKMAIAANRVPACLKILQPLYKKLAAANSMCVKEHLAAGKVCIESLSPTIQGAMLVLMPLLKASSSSSIKENCSKSQSISDIAQKALVAYQMICGGAKAFCDASCGTTLKDLEAINVANEKCLITAQELDAGMSLYASGPLNLPLAKSYVEEFNVLHKLVITPTPGSIGNRAKICGQNYGQMLTMGAVGLVQIMAQNKAASQCSDLTAGTLDECAKISDPTAQKACYDTVCAKPEYSSNQICLEKTCTNEATMFAGNCASYVCAKENYRFHDGCLKITCTIASYASSAACSKCQTQPELCGRASSNASTNSTVSGSSLAAGYGTKTTSSSSSGGSSGGGSGPSLNGLGMNDSPNSSSGGGSPTAGPPASGGGGSLLGGSGVGGGASDTSNPTQKRLSASIFGGEGGGAGGGFGGYRGSNDSNGLRRYVPGGANDPRAAKISGMDAGASKEISGAYGKSLWEKVKERYNDNKSTLKND